MSFVDFNFRLYSDETAVYFGYRINSAVNHRELFFQLKDFRKTLLGIADGCEALSTLKGKIDFLRSKEMTVQIKFNRLNDLLLSEGFVRDSHPPIVFAQKPSEENCVLLRAVFLYLKEEKRSSQLTA